MLGKRRVGFRHSQLARVVASLRRHRSALALLLISAAALPAAVVTVRRNGAWKSEYTLLTSTLRQYPMNPMSLYGMGWARELENWPLAAYYHTRAVLAREACVGHTSLHPSARRATCAHAAWCLGSDAAPLVCVRVLGPRFADPMMALAETADTEGDPGKSVRLCVRP